MNKALGILSIGLAISVIVASCASSPEKRFDRVLPGMSAAEVENKMGSGPTRFENIPDTSYSSWYWGENHCVLFHDLKVVAKDSTETKKSAKIAGGGYEEKRMAQCLAPGQSKEVGNARVINIPGVGTIQLPLASITPEKR